jgi:VCBS repeat-containing protein
VSANYTISYVNGSLTVTPAALTVTADTQTKAYGAPNPPLTVSYSGFVNGDTAASLTTPPTVTTPATTASAVGTYPITASGAVSASYTISYVSGTLTVTAVNQAPVAANNSYTTNEDTALTVGAPGVLGNDTDFDGSALTAGLVTGPANGTLTLNANGGFTYTPNANFSGADSVTYRANDGTADSNVATVSITVTAVNDAPSFTKDADQTVVQDAGAQTVAGWATNISAGPPDESWQTLNFIVTTNNNALFSAQPAVSPSGTLTFSPATGATGSATVTVQLHDNGGVANGGVDTSAPQTFTITITVTSKPSLSVANTSVIEGNGGCNPTTPMPVTVTLSAASSLTVTVNYQTLNGTATGDAVCGSKSRGHIIASGTLTFAPGQTSKVVTIHVVGDSFKESNQTFVVRLSNPINATITKFDGIGTIIDDD